MDWRAYLFKPETYKRLEQLARQCFPDSSKVDDAEEAFNYALDRLETTDYEQLKGYKGICTPTGFLQCHFKNLLVDYGRRKYGRPRPPTWCKRIGLLCETIFELLCVRRWEPEAIVHRMTNDGGREPERVREVIEDISGRIPDCGQEVRTVDEEQCDREHSGLSSEELLLAEVRRKVKEVLEDFLGDEATATQVGNSDAFVHLREGLLAMSPVERLVLKMVFEHDIKIPRVAKELQLAEHKVRKICKEALQRIRSTFEEAGLADYFRPTSKA
jgi:DNA-directed RNA polymerase specialized sigma24 family protein